MAEKILKEADRILSMKQSPNPQGSWKASPNCGLRQYRSEWDVRQASFKFEETNLRHGRTPTPPKPDKPSLKPKPRLDKPCVYENNVAKNCDSPYHCHRHHEKVTKPEENGLGLRQIWDPRETKDREFQKQDDETRYEYNSVNLFFSKFF
jgi:hypothetical protein